MSKIANKRSNSSAGPHAAIALIVLALCLAAAVVLLPRFGLTGAKRYGADATPEPTAAPVPSQTIEPTPAPSEAPTAEPAAETPAPTPSPSDGYVPTAIIVDGESCVVLASRQAAEELLNQVIQHYDRLCPGSGHVSAFVNDVSLAVSTGGGTVSFDQAYTLLIGEDSPLHVRTSFVTSDFETIPYTAVSSESELYYEGTRFVASYGRDGKKLVVHEYTYVNGEPASVTIAEERLLAEPVSESVIIGTKPIPEEDVADGSFGLEDCPSAPFVFVPPIDGELSRYFGFYGGSLHRGVDFACPAGAKCFSAAGGIVIAVFERGSLGLTVDIDHGSGFVTRYSLLERADVSVGEQVPRGLEIGKAGENGLHFEVILDGVPRNPFGYIEFGSSWF